MDFRHVIDGGAYDSTHPEQACGIVHAEGGNKDPFTYL